MRKMFFISIFEYKMQMRRIATWGVFITATTITLLDNFPSASNLARLEFLSQPNYFVCRAMSLNGLILVFGLMFLLSNRFHVDHKAGVKSLFMAAPIQKGQYIGGKLFAGFLYTLTIIILFLVLNTTAYAIFSPIKSGVAEYLMPLGKTIVVSAIPVSFFISFCAIAIPAVVDIRLFYFAISVVFIINAATVGSAEKMPFYLITAGDLIKLIWQRPKWPFNDMTSIAANLMFLIGCGLLSWLLILCKRKFWRAE